MNCSSNGVNVKLMIQGAKVNVKYKELLNLLECGNNNYDCTMNLCQKCPCKETVLEIFNLKRTCLPIYSLSNESQFTELKKLSHKKPRLLF